ncbi:hypothetical protein RKE29_22890, partial [Streptomyces sp. B1866]|nr:hypothetical protein [Streptomyces sp. B1866]
MTAHRPSPDEVPDTFRSSHPAAGRSSAPRENPASAESAGIKPNPEQAARRPRSPSAAASGGPP